MHVRKTMRRKAAWVVLPLVLLVGALAIATTGLGSTGAKHAKAAGPITIGKGGGFGEIYIQTGYDPSPAPEGKHLLSVFGQYAPYEISEGDWDSRRDDVARQFIDLIDRFAPGFEGRLVAHEVLGPPDIESRIGLTGGNIFQGEVTPDQMWEGRLSARTPVPGLNPSIVASRVRTRGETRSTCDVPRRHPRHVPYFSFFASIPQRLYIDTTQFCALRWMAVPVSRGPMESRSVAASCSTRELSIPIAQMRRRTGSSVGNDGVLCARAGAASAIRSAMMAGVRRRIMQRDSVTRSNVGCMAQVERRSADLEAR